MPSPARPTASSSFAQRIREKDKNGHLRGPNGYLAPLRPSSQCGLHLRDKELADCQAALKPQDGDERTHQSFLSSITRRFRLYRELLDGITRFGHTTLEPAYDLGPNLVDPGARVIGSNRKHVLTFQSLP